MKFTCITRLFVVIQGLILLSLSTPTYADEVLKTRADDTLRKGSVCHFLIGTEYGPSRQKYPGARNCVRACRSMASQYKQMNNSKTSDRQDLEFFLKQDISACETSYETVMTHVSTQELAQLNQRFIESQTPKPRLTSQDRLKQKIEKLKIDLNDQSKQAELDQFMAACSSQYNTEICTCKSYGYIRLLNQTKHNSPMPYSLLLRNSSC